jgi:23S rRNA pseudouridine2605 synthase
MCAYQKKDTSGRGRATGKKVAQKTRGGDSKSKPKFVHKSDAFKNKKRKGDAVPTFSENIRLNKYLANAGICSRREADVFIATGLVEINGELVLEMGYKVKPDDEVKYDGALISQSTKRYVILNKPKDFIAGSTDAWGRKSVNQLVFNACKERIVAVDRLDKYGMGILLFTNDSDLLKKLNHPRHTKKQIYHVEVQKNINTDHMKAMVEGFELPEGGFAKAEKVDFVRDGKPKEAGIEIQSGKFRIVERMFEHFGYQVRKLDRVYYGGLTKKDLPRGNYRHLTEAEVGFMKM